MNNNILVKALIVIAVLSTSVLANKYKISSNNIASVKIPPSGTTIFQFNFLVKSVRPITRKENIVSTRLLDKGFLLIPREIPVDGLLLVTNEKGTSYSIQFESDPSLKEKNKVFLMEDLSYEHNAKSSSKFNFESSDIDTDVSNILKAVDNNKKLSGFDLEEDNYLLKASDFTMNRRLRWIGKKYVLEKWVLKNTSSGDLIFRNRDFAAEGILAVSILPEPVGPGESSIGYFLINKATLVE